MKPYVRFLLAAFTVLIIPVTILASGKIKGRVVDKETKEPLIGANVIVVGTVHGTATDNVGEYWISDMPEGEHTLKVSYVGYATTTIERVTVYFNLTTEVLVELTPTSVSLQAVVVEAERPLINKNATNAVRVVTNEEMHTLPFRGVENVVALQAGVVQQDYVLHVRGGRQDEVGFQVDGLGIVDAMYGNRITVVQEAVEQITVQSSGYEAEYGRANAGIVQYALKTGTPRFKATLEYVTDNIGFESASSFGNGKKRLGAYWYGFDDFTATASGPVLDERFKYFGLFNYQFQRDRDPQPYTGVDIGPIKDPDSRDSINLVYPAGVLLKNSRQVYTFTGTMNADLLPVKLRLSGSYSDTRAYSTDVTWFMDLGRTPVTDRNSGFGTLKGTYSFDPKAFVEISGGLFMNHWKVSDPALGDNYLAYGDSVANARAGFVWNRRPGEPTGRYVTPQRYNIYGWYFAPAGAPLSAYQKTQSDNISFNVSLTAQLGRYHTIKLGGDFLRYTFRLYLVNAPAGLALSIAENDTSTGTNKKTLEQIMTPTVSRLGYDVLGNELNTSDFSGPRHPVYASVFIQDKMEYEDLVLNVGIRGDYINPDTYAMKDPTHPELSADVNTLTPIASGLVHSPGAWYVTPRFGASFSLSDRTVFHTQFAKLVQQPRLNESYQTARGFAITSTGGGVTRGNLNPEHTTQYEVGISQQLGDKASLDVTAYYKDVYDQVRLDPVVTAASSPAGRYLQWVNGDFATTKGIELSFRMRRVSRLLANATVSFQDGAGSGSYALPSLRGPLRDMMIAPLDYNQKVRGNVFLDYRFGIDEGSRVFQGFGATLVMTFSSGHPYTWVDPFAWRPLEAMNTSLTPSWFQADLRLEKTFTFARDLVSTIYVAILNVFDNRNVTNVWPPTGSAADDGWLSEPTLGMKLVETKGQPYADLYRQLWLNYGRMGADGDLTSSPRYGSPRQIRIGIRLEY